MAIIQEVVEAVNGGVLGGGHTPFFTCDGCDEKLDNGMGKIVWEIKTPTTFTEGEVASTGRFWTFGKGPEHQGCETDETRSQPWDDLDEFILNLAHNSKLDLSLAESRMSDRRDQFGL